jgi:hypothetical protein
MKREEPLKLMPLDDLKKVLAEIVQVAKPKVSKPGPHSKRTKKEPRRSGAPN